MAIFKELTSLWKSEDLLSQAWDESYKMMLISNEMFDNAITHLREGEKTKKLKKLKKRDREINNFHKSVRKKVVTHFSVSKNVQDIPNGLVLLSIVVDVERLGDYTKNILDLAIHYPKPLIAEKLLTPLKEIEEQIHLMFINVIRSIENNDDQMAKKILKTYGKSLAGTSDKIVNNCIAGNHVFKDGSQAASVVLYARYLKRIGAHLKNISTTILNPYDYIGYKTPNNFDI